ncbi:MAG: lipid-A-disaccharide synthase [Thermodesulfovibrionia bacterium]
MISTGEASGELYGILLSREIKRLWQDVEILGIGGLRMKEEGITMVSEGSNIIGLTEAIRHLNRAWMSLKRAKEVMERKMPDIIVLIDYPDFNLALAKRAKELGIPVLYYVSPQVWAWRKGRIKKMASLVDRVALILPFEADYYKDRGIRYEFVGHPIVETIDIKESKEGLKMRLHLDPQRPLITLLPGSRPVEIERHLPILKRVGSMIHDEMPEFQLAIPITEEAIIDDKLDDYIKVIRGETLKALASSEASAIASGTATLEAALLNTPMVVFYRLSPVTYMIARLLIRVDYISLVNLIMRRCVVRELIQMDATPENIYSELRRIIQEPLYRDEMIHNLKTIRGIMMDKRPSQRVAEIIGEITGWSNTRGY